MIREGGILRGLRAAGSGVVLLSLCACMGGTGTDTENGIKISARVVTSSNTPVADVQVQVLDLTASAMSSTENPLLDSTDVLTTDTAGKVIIFLKKAGKYIAQGRKGDSILFADTLRVVEKKPGGPIMPGLGDPQFVVESPIKAEGQIKLLSGFKTDSGRVVIQGTKLESKLSNGSTYKLGWLPLSMEKLTLNASYGARASTKRYVKVVDKGDAGWQLLMDVTKGGICMTDTGASSSSTSNQGGGSLKNAATWARVAAAACKGTAGSEVQVLEANASGKVIKKLGDYVIPDAAAGIPDSAAVPVGCIRTGTSGASQASLKLLTGQILVNDIQRGGGCPAP